MHKTILFSLIALTASFTASAKDNKTYKLTGKVDQATHVLIAAEGQSIMDADSVAVASDGTFTYTRQLDHDGMGFIYVPDRAIAPLIMIGGTETRLVPANLPPAMTEADYDDEEGPTIVGAPFTYEGKLRQAYDFSDRMHAAMRYHTEHDGGSFAQLQKALTALVDSVEQAAAKVKPAAFAAVASREIRGAVRSDLVSYRERLGRQGRSMTSDPDYNQYMRSLHPQNATEVVPYLAWREAYETPQGIDYVKIFDWIAEAVDDEELRQSSYANYMNDALLIDDAAKMTAAWEKVSPLITSERRKASLQRVYTTRQTILSSTDLIDRPLFAPDGKQSQLADVAKGKLTYIDIWATWCGPCVAEIPYVEKLVDHYKGDDRIQFVSISVDSDEAAWKRKLDKDKPQWAQYLDKGFTQAYGITGIPCFIIIGPDGRLISTAATRPSDLKTRETLDKLLEGAE